MTISQLTFNIAKTPTYRPEDFIWSTSNQEAFDYMESWPKWVDMGVFLFGPPSCGKTHLVNMWHQRADAKIIPLNKLSDLDFDTLPTAVAIEDIQHMTPPQAEALFHLYNRLQQNKGNLVVTANQPLMELNIPLKDLRSRLSRLVALKIHRPDQNLMRMYILKIFSDLQVKVSENEIKFLAGRLPRDFKKVYEAIRHINEASLREKRKITIPFIKQVLGEP